MMMSSFALIVAAAVSFCGPEVVPAAKEKTYKHDVEVRIDSAQTFTVRCPDAAAVPWVKSHVKRWFRQEPKVVAAKFADADWTIGDEGYRLKARPDGIQIEAKTLQGVRYALMTIRHFAERNSVGRKLSYYRIAQIDITDYPALKFRGMHFCWFPEQSAELMERQIRAAAFYKFNYVVIESWGVYRSEKHPWFGWKDGPMTPKTIRRLVSVAKDLGVTLIPQINVFGHASASRGSGKHATLDFGEEYQPLFEPINGWNWCLSNPDARAVVREIVAEMHEAFGNPPYFHVGCDEAGHPVCASCRAADYGQLLRTHITEIGDLLRKRGARMMLWHDQLLVKGDTRWKGFYAYGTETTAKLLSALPKDAVLCDWYYNEPPKPRTDGKPLYPTLAYFAKDCGFDVLTCPWKTPSGIAAQAKFARENGLFGLLGTSWHHFGGDNFPLLVQQSSYAAWECGDRVMPRLNSANFAMVWRWAGWDMGASDYKETGWRDVQVTRDILYRFDTY